VEKDVIKRHPGSGRPPTRQTPPAPDAKRDPRVGEAVQRVAERLGGLPQVVAVAIAGSRGAGLQDASSDVDLYVYALGEVPLEFRRELGGAGAEIANRFWEPGDEWLDAASGLHFDIMYRSPAWIEGQLDRVLVRHEASLGYTTCFWYNIIHSQAIVDPRGWYATLQQRAHVPYPEGLRRAIVEENLPVLRRNRSSYRAQIARALERNDLVSRQHRITALLASVFDIAFALELEPHPGEKRLLDYLPEALAELVRGVIEAGADLLERIDSLLDAVERRIEAQGLTLPAASIEHVAAWVADLDRACAFYVRWFGGVPGPLYRSQRRPLASRFVSIGNAARLELMTMAGEPARPAHIAISVGSRDAVDWLVERMRADGIGIASGPRLTGDGYYEAVVIDTEGNLVEITA
jgi:catechol 2,3-dioxygenase-like lactoylglutathione lyase family enzyme/predicted nucleotidyltransferase